MSSFRLNSGDSEFRNRQKAVFDQLGSLEKNRTTTNYGNKEIEEDEDHGSNRQQRINKKSQKSEMRHFRGKESIFKKPQNPVPRNYINRMPDFKKNPHKWTKYSLEDVQEMTEESNRKSALDFLKELANRKKIEQGVPIEEEISELPTKIVFNKHVKEGSLKKFKKSVPDSDDKMDSEERTSSSSSSSPPTDEKPSFSSSKIIMPEYVIGQKRTKKDRNIRKSKPDVGKQIKLSLFEDDEDD